MQNTELYEKRIPFLKNIHFHPWAVAPSLCLFPWPCVQRRLQMWDCNHCRILPHLPWCKVTGLPDFEWLRNYSIWVLSPIITHMGTSSLDLGINLGNSSHQTLHGVLISLQVPAWVFMELRQRSTSHQPWHSCLRREFIQPFENFCSPQREVCWLQSLRRSQ